tara:strand:+ start:683 stop:1060 length:378 start_codon:yes stop_codon:yes gene_type:complete
VVQNYSTVTECVRYDVVDPKNSKDLFLKISFTLSIENCNLNISNYTRYQQKLYRLIKFMKENRGLGYKRISHIMTEKGYRSVRTKSILKPNFIFSIYNKGKLREDRLKRKYKSTVKDIQYLVFDL